MKVKLTKVERQRIKVETYNQAPQKVLTFAESIQMLFKVIWWRFTPKQWIGRRVYVYGKVRAVTSETFGHIFIQGISHAIRKDSRYLTLK